MKKRVVILSSVYSLSSIFAGLVLHPYQTMQKLIREKVFIWLAFLPLMLLLFVIALGQLLIGFLPDVTSILLNNVLINFVINTFIFYCIYWQLLLIYLVIRFLIVFGI